MKRIILAALLLAGCEREVTHPNIFETDIDTRFGTEPTPSPTPEDVVTLYVAPSLRDICETNTSDFDRGSGFDPCVAYWLRKIAEKECLE